MQFGKMQALIQMQDGIPVVWQVLVGRGPLNDMHNVCMARVR